MRAKKDKTGGALRTEALPIKLTNLPPPALVLITEHAPNVERMMRGVMAACGVGREEMERLLRERREQVKHNQRVAS